MRLLELALTVPAADRDEAVAAVMRLGVNGVQIEDDDTGRADTATVRAWFPFDADRAALARALAPRVPVLRPVRVDWQGEAGAVRVGRRFLVAGPDDRVGPTRRVVLRVDGTAAFGDGRHPTTVLCLLAVERAFREAPPATVLDVGTGTGVLALAAARLGAGRVVGTDIDALSREAARAAATAHGVGLEVRETLPEGRFDLVLANLYRDPLLALAPELAARTGGRLYVSGVVRAARAEVEAAFTDAGLRVSRRHRRGWWVGLELVPPARR